MRTHGIIFAVVALLVVLGFYGLYDMNKDEFPQFTIRQGVVAGVYPGATSEQVEEQLTRPIERYLFTFQEVDKSKTYSYSEDGIAYIFVEL
ncbi:MAG: efflux RND transporter permease subunit, partial [Paludibacteraceae bacterium]|nr:efflux RND transporter permease subunit [Paludibacteraceae bacterium]